MTTTMSFKYQQEIEALIDCAQHEWRQSSGIAHHWVKNPITAECFLPPGKLPKRRVKCCTDVGLSLYRTVEQAKTAFRKTCDQFPNFVKQFSHVAVGDLDATCGMTTVEDAAGHFDLHEFVAANVATKFDIACPL